MSTDVYGIFSLRSKGREEMSASAWGANPGGRVGGILCEVRIRGTGMKYVYGKGEKGGGVDIM